MLPLIEAEEAIDPPPPGFQRPCTTLDLKKAPQPKASQCVSRVKSFLERSRSRSVASAAPLFLSACETHRQKGQWPPLQHSPNLFCKHKLVLPRQPLGLR